MLDHIGDMAFIVGENGRPVYMNNSACRALHVTRDEVTGLNVQDIGAQQTGMSVEAFKERLVQAGR